MLRFAPDGENNFKALGRLTGVKASASKHIAVWLIALCAISGLVVAAALAPINGETGPDFFRFLGRFHPLALHLPIAFLVLAPLCEASRLSPKTAHLARATTPILFLASISAFLTVALGLTLAASEGHGGALVDKHRWGGVTVASLATIAFALRFTLGERRSPVGWSVYGGVLAVASCALVITAHAGGSLVHGPQYLAEFAPPHLAKILGEGESDEPAAETAHGDLPVSEPTLAAFKSDVNPLFGRYCARCHGDGKQEANFRVASLVPEMTNSFEVHDWRRVMNKLNTYQMPPEDAAQPTEDERARIVSWIETAMNEEATWRRSHNVTPHIRRLSKREYNHTLQDLFRTTANFASKLPQDPLSEKGYDTDASLLRVSEVDLRIYMEIARQAVDRYVTFGQPTDEVEHYFQEFEDNYFFGRWRAHQLAIARAPRPLPAGEFEKRVAAHEASAPVYHEQFLGPVPYGKVSYSGEGDDSDVRGYPRRHEMFVYIPTVKTVGEMVVRVSAAATPAADDGSFPRLRLEVGESYDRNLIALNVGEYDVTASKDDPGVYEFRFLLEDTRSAPNPTLGGGPGDFDRPLLLVFSNVARNEDGVVGPSRYAQEDPLLPDGIRINGNLPGSTKAVMKGDEEATEKLLETQPGFLHLDSLEITITPVAAEPDVGWSIARPAEGAGPDEEQRLVRETLEEFLPIAFRRPVTEAEVARYLSTFSGLREINESYDTAVRETLASVLVSAEFLFIGAPLPDGYLADQKNPEAVERSLALASRLSYFIWSSAPDERLRAIASEGKLADPRALAEETTRMLDDEKSRRFTDAFARQWLKLGGLNAGTVSTERYPEYGPELGKLMVQQTVDTFQDVFHNNRDARSLYTDDYMFLNDQLARHYGLEGVVEGGDLRRVPVDKPVNRGGLIGQASVLAINSDGVDSHPVKRGVWLLERILDDPPPPPPPNVPVLGADGVSLVGLTLREQIEGHRNKPACNACHTKIDPWGLALENFDASGAYRQEVTVGEGENEIVKPVDAHTVLPDGEKINGAGDLGSYLLSEREQDIMRGLARHMFAYGIGREMDILDEQEAEQATQMFRTSGYSLKHLVLAIVQSDSFAPQKEDNSDG